MSTETNAYILGTDLEEMNRLGLQHQVWASEAQTGWDIAQYNKGMTILDLGSGPGFCTRELAKIVGQEGKVIAVDKSEVYLNYINQINSIQQLNIETLLTDFNNLKLTDNSIDGMYSRWALAWVADVESVLAKVYSALRPGGKVVIHEYSDWMTHQIVPSHPTVQKAIKSCFQSFEDSEGTINIGKDLPQMLSQSGFKVTSTRTMSKMSSPNQFTWQWPRSFYDSYWPKIQAMGYLTEAELNEAKKELESIEKLPHAILICPTLIEIVAEK